MAISVYLPPLGEGITQGTVVKVLVSVRDAIKVGDPLADIEVGKAVVSIPSPEAGTVTRIHVRDGQLLNVGDPLMDLDLDLETETHKEKEGDSINPPYPPLSKGETNLNREPLPASPSSLASLKESSVGHHKQSSTFHREISHEIYAGPAARKAAREAGLHLSHVRGSGKNGRIDKRDVFAYRDELKDNRARLVQASTADVAINPPYPPLSKGETATLPSVTSIQNATTSQPMTSIRRIIADTMALAWTTIPHVFQHHDIDITDLMQDLDQAKKDKSPIRLTHHLIHALAQTIKEMPIFNARVDMTTHTLFFHDRIHLGIAVDTEHGLVVPVIQDADQKTVPELKDTLATLVKAARTRTLTLDQLSGSTCSLSNLGGFGVGPFTPIITPPQVAVLGVAAHITRPVYMNNTWEPRLLLPITLSYDHRAIDGADAARFVKRFESILGDRATLYSSSIHE